MYKKWLLRVLLALMLWGCVHLIILLGVGFFSVPPRSDVLLIFGNTVLPNGQVSPRLQTRLDEGIRLYELGFAPYIVVSGMIMGKSREKDEILLLMKKNIYPSKNFSLQS